MKYFKSCWGMLAAAGVLLAASVAPSEAVFTSKGVNPPITASAAVGGTPTVAITSVQVKNRADDQPNTSGLAWTGAAPGAGWLVSDQYIQLVTNINTTDGGVQIYTDNTNAAANPKFTGQVSTFTATPAGLVNVTDTTSKLPTAWRASTFTIAGILPINPNGDTSKANNPEHFLWFFHMDAAQVKVPSLNATTFHPGDAFVTVYASPATPLTSTFYANATDQANGVETTQTFTTNSANSGLHFAQGPTQFGGFNSTATTFIYTEADFTGALAQQTYTTNRLILEAFSL